MTFPAFPRSALLLTAAIIAVPALAQDAAPAPVAVAAAADDAGLDEIVVTAERRSENLQKVPLSVAVVQGAQYRDFQAGGEDLLSLSGRVPGLYAETTTGRIFPRFYIRGLGNIDFYLGASQPVSIIQDDVVLEHVVLKSNPVYDLAQVEVLRGPQGSLFGRNTTAGIIKFDTVKPSQDFNARADASYGSYNTVTLDAGVGGPIIADKLAIRVSGLYQHRDDWVDNTFTGFSRDGTVTPKKNAMGGFDERDARVQLLLTPDDRLTMLLSAHARSYDGHLDAVPPRRPDQGFERRQRDAARRGLAYDEANNNPQKYHTYGTSMRIGIRSRRRDADLDQRLRDQPRLLARRHRRRRCRELPGRRRAQRLRPVAGPAAQARPADPGNPPRDRTATGRSSGSSAASGSTSATSPSSISAASS